MHLKKIIDFVLTKRVQTTMLLPNRNLSSSYGQKPEIPQISGIFGHSDPFTGLTKGGFLSPKRCDNLPQTP